MESRGSSRPDPTLVGVWARSPLWCPPALPLGTTHAPLEGQAKGRIGRRHISGEKRMWEAKCGGHASIISALQETEAGGQDSKLKPSLGNLKRS